MPRAHMQSRVKKWTTEERTQVCKKGRCLAGRIRRDFAEDIAFETVCNRRKGLNRLHIKEVFLHIGTTKTKAERQDHGSQAGRKVRSGT